MQFYVYIIYNKNFDKFYIGQTNNLERRILEHNAKEKNKYTSRFNGKWILVYTENFSFRNEAQKRESFLKKQKNKEFYKKLCNIK